MAGGWMIVVMHGVGIGTHGLFIDRDEHTRLLEWIAAKADALWSATVSDAAAIMNALPE